MNGDTLIYGATIMPLADDLLTLTDDMLVSLHSRHWVGVSGQGPLAAEPASVADGPSEPVVRRWWRFW